MFCKNCGKKLNSNSKFCRFCGEKQITQILNEKNEEVFIEETERGSFLSRLFHGRIDRKNYIVGFILFYASFYATCFCIGLIYGYVFKPQVVSDNLSNLLVLLPTLLLIFFGFSIGIRRVHDLNHSGWYLLWGIIPIGNIILAINLLFARGTNGKNKYGEKPNGSVDIGNLVGF